MKVTDKTVTIENNNFQFTKAGGVVVHDCDNNPMGTVPGPLLDKIIAAAESVSKAPARLTLEDTEYDIQYGGSSVDFGGGARVYSIADLKRLQKVSKSLRK